MLKAPTFSLVALTLNIAGPRFLHQGWPTRRESILVQLRAEAPDAAAFQEVWRREDSDALAEAAAAPARAYDGDLGLSVASRWPIVARSAKNLGGGYGSLRARVSTPRGVIDVYSTRLEPGTGTAEARRMAQLFRLSEYIREESAGVPFILLGDLGAAADDRESTLFLDLLEVRDLCVAHGDDVCGRTLDDRRVDFALIPYASRAPKDPARTAFTSPIADDDENDAATLHFGLRAKVGAEILHLKPAAQPPGRDEALAAVASILDAASLEASRRAKEAGWIPWLGTWSIHNERRESEELSAAAEEVRTAQIRAAAGTAPTPDG